MVTPGGRVASISLTRIFTRSTTCCAFSPANIWTMPMTVSPSPIAVAAPMRRADASFTSARSEINIGTPPEPRATTILARSATWVAKASPRMSNCSR